MNITSKSRYALKILMDLLDRNEDVIHRSDIAERQGIPSDYMDQILARLREGGLISSLRGRSGGYRFAKDPSDISVFDIFVAVEDAFQPVQCLDHTQGCIARDVCRSKDAWSVISDAIHGALSGIILTDLADKKVTTERVDSVKGATPHECRAPKRRVGGTKVEHEAPTRQ